jgi:hypothetical protein
LLITAGSNQYSATLLMAMQQKYREVLDGAPPPAQQQEQQEGEGAMQGAAAGGGGGGGAPAGASGGLAPTPKDDFINALVKAACATEGEKVVVFSEVCVCEGGGC